jgi:hypothetical protein
MISHRCAAGHLTLTPTRCPWCKTPKGVVTRMGGCKEKEVFHGMRKGHPGQVEAYRKKREAKAC